MGGGVPLPDQGVFAFSDLKSSDLVHTLGERFAKLSIGKGRKYTFTDRRARTLSFGGTKSRRGYLFVLNPVRVSEATEQVEGVSPLPRQGHFLNLRYKSHVFRPFIHTFLRN